MVDMKNNDPNLFPLNLERLKIYACRWADEIQGARIQKVILYRYSSYYAKILSKQVPVKYCVVFDVKDEIMTNPDTEHTHGKPSIAGSIYSYLECFFTIHDQDSYLSLMDAGFTDVYSHKPDENFKDEWTFLSRRLAEGNPSIKFEEPCWVLYPELDVDDYINSSRAASKSNEEIVYNLKNIYKLPFKSIVIKLGLLTEGVNISDNAITQKGKRLYDKWTKKMSQAHQTIDKM